MTESPLYPAGLPLGRGVLLRNARAGTAADDTTLRSRIRSAMKDPDRLVGTTLGGGTLKCVPVLHTCGTRTRLSDDPAIDGWEVTLSGTLVPDSLSALKAALPGAETRKSRGITRLTLPDGEADDSPEEICWAGDTPRGLTVILLEHPLASGGLNFVFDDRGRGPVPFTLTARTDLDGWDAPFRVLFAEKEEE